MQFVTYQSRDGARAAAVIQDRYVDLNLADSTLPTSLVELLRLRQSGLDRARAAAAQGKPIAPEGVKLLAPIPEPQKIICVGLNYRDHAKEGGKEPPAEPVFFNKLPTTVRGHGDEIVLPAVSREVDYEAELVAVISVGGRNISRANALQHVAGYCCGHDVSARDWQLRKPGGQWLLGKSFDSFAPFGPRLVTSDEVGDPGRLNIELRLNGRTMQKSNTRELIFPVDELIAYVSQVCTLVPGDVLFTGTPAGVGGARKPPVYLQPGDIVEVEIEKLGVLRNAVVAASGR